MTDIRHSKAKADLREIWTAPDRATAKTAITTFAEKYGAKYEKVATAQPVTQDSVAEAKPRQICSTHPPG